jgi:trigger factor
MHVTTTPAEKSTVLLEVELPAADLARAVVDATRRLSQRTRIPGFRPGKAPRSMVERELGPGAVLDEAVEQLVERSFRAAMAEQTDLFAIGRPAIDVVQAEEGQPFRFTATIPVRPEVRLGDYRAFPFAPEIDTVDDPKVDRVVDELRDQQASLVPVEERGAKDDDWAVIGFVGTRDGEPFEGGTLERMPIVIGQERIMPGFEGHLVGLRVGDSTEFDITFPLDYREASLQGAAAHFTVTMRELREKVLPAADDAFAASLGEFEDLATLRSEVRTRLERSAIDRARHGFADRIIDYAVKNATVEIPDLLVDEEIEVMHDELRGALARQGITEEAYLKATEKTPEQLHADFRPGAQERAKTLLVLGKIAEAEGTEVTDADVADEASRAKQRYANDPKLAVYFDTGRARAAIRSSLRRSRVVEKVIDDWLAAHPEHPAIPHREDPSVDAGAAAVAGAAVEEAGSARA